MRAFRFRQFIDGRFKYSGMCDPRFDNSFTAPHCYFDCYYLEQFTGLLDKNGVEIFEGDILQPSAYSKTDWARGTVISHKGMFCLDVNKPWIAKRRPLYESLQDSKKANNDFIVIGNIHQEDKS